ncbi:AraC family transcriptional regulator, partial [Xanthomonas hortorum pv. gardneri]
MTIENPPTTVDALLPGVRASFEWADGPEVIAFLADLHAVWAPETAPHAHVRGQLMYVEHGVLTVHTEQGTLSLPPGCAGWMPPGQQHTVELAGPMRGWGVVVRPDACAALPAQGGVIRLTGLAREVIMRAAGWPLDQPLDSAQQRLAAVLLDELCQVQIDHLHLPMPADRRLL